MILVFTQWCINHDLNPEAVYLKAYPDQAENQVLKDALALTVPKEEAGEVPDETLLSVLSLFGNDALAFIVTEEIAGGMERKSCNHEKGMPLDNPMYSPFLILKESMC